nr:Transposon Ty3-I Gag-Pol polyprotein [Ipomoea batatas]
MHSPPCNYDRKKSPNSRSNERRRPLRCFVCQGDHKFANCPKYGKLSAMFSRTSDEPIEDPSDEEDDALQMSSLKVLGAISHPSSTTDLLYVDVVINGKKSRALIDTGATHNFIEEAEATRLKLRTEPRRQLIKTVNQRPQPTVGIEKDVTVRVGPWKGRVSFTVTAMDDYKIVLGMDAMKQHHIVPLPHRRSISIQQSGHPLIIPAVPPSVMKINRLLAMTKSGESEVRDPFHGAPRSKLRPYEALAVKDIKRIRHQMKGKPTKLTLKFGGEPILQVLLDREEGVGDNFEMMEVVESTYGNQRRAEVGPKSSGGGCDAPTLGHDKISPHKVPVEVRHPKTHPQDQCMHRRPTCKPRIRA